MQGFAISNIPIFFAIDPDNLIKTTLLRDLDGYSNSKVVYKVMENGIENNNILEFLMCRLNDIKDADTFQFKIDFLWYFIHPFIQ